jgi:hypothetical protein
MMAESLKARGMGGNALPCRLGTPVVPIATAAGRPVRLKILSARTNGCEITKNADDCVMLADALYR